jgi:hypothetical protein
MHALTGREKASLVMTGTILFRGTLAECLARWIELPDARRASAHVEFPTMTRGCYSLDTRDMHLVHQKLSDAVPKQVAGDTFRRLVGITVGMFSADPKKSK